MCVVIDAVCFLKLRFTIHYTRLNNTRFGLLPYLGVAWLVPNELNIELVRL